MHVWCLRAFCCIQYWSGRFSGRQRFTMCMHGEVVEMAQLSQQSYCPDLEVYTLRQVKLMAIEAWTCVARLVQVSRCMVVSVLLWRIKQTNWLLYLDGIGCLWTLIKCMTHPFHFCNKFKGLEVVLFIDHFPHLDFSLIKCWDVLNHNVWCLDDAGNYLKFRINLRYMSSTNACLGSI